MKSDAARKALRIGTCELMHLRVAGQVRFRKQGNAFLYSLEDVERLRGTLTASRNSSARDPEAKGKQIREL